LGGGQAQRALENQEQLKLQKKVENIRNQISTLEDALRSSETAADPRGKKDSFLSQTKRNAQVSVLALLVTGPSGCLLEYLSTCRKSK